MGDKKQLRKVSTPKPSLGNTRQESGCSPSMREGLTRGPMQTERASTRAAGRRSGQKCWRLSSRRNWMSGTRGPGLDFQSGLASAPARRLELQIPQRVRRTRLRVPRQRRCMRRKRMRKTTTRRKSNANIVDHSNVCSDNVKKKKNAAQKKKKKKKKKSFRRKKKKKKKKKKYSA